MNCPKCGNKLNNTACDNCGFGLKRDRFCLLAGDGLFYTRSLEQYIREEDSITCMKETAGVLPRSTEEKTEEKTEQKTEQGEAWEISILDRYAAYALGIADPEVHPWEGLSLVEDRQAYEAWRSIISQHRMEIQEKRRIWVQFGNIMAGSSLVGTKPYFWLLTDRGTVILAGIPKRMRTEGYLFDDVWSIGDFGSKFKQKKYFGYDEGSRLSEAEFIQMKPSVLFIDDNIKKLSFKHHVGAFYQIPCDGVTWREHEYYCETMHWVEKLVFYHDLSFVPFDYNARGKWFNAEVSTHEDIRMHVSSHHEYGEELFQDHLKLEGMNKSAAMYTCRDGIIYDKKGHEVLCLNGENNKRRYRQSIWDMYEQVGNRYQRMGRCRHCGGAFSGLFIKKCQACGRKKDYKS